MSILTRYSYTGRTQAGSRHLHESYQWDTGTRFGRRDTHVESSLEACALGCLLRIEGRLQEVV